MIASLLKSSQSILIKKEDHYEMLIYTDELTKPVIVETSIKIRQAFPALPKEFFDILSDRIIDNKFSDKRLIDAAKHVIDNCIYPTPTIAQFIAFDRRIKLYDYNQVLKLNEELGGKAFEFYRPVRIGENVKPVYARVNDIKEFNLEIWRKE